MQNASDDDEMFGRIKTRKEWRKLRKTPARPKRFTKKVNG